MRALKYALDEAITSVWRRRQSGLLSTITIALAIFVLGGFLLVTTNLQRLSTRWSSAAEISVYVNDAVRADERAAIERTLAAAPIVAGREFVSKDEALSRFKQTFGDLSATVDGAGVNPLPASYEVRVKPGPEARTAVEPLAAQLRQLPGVSDVRSDWPWLDRLLTGIGVIRGVGLLLGAILALAAALTVANVVRLGLYARKDEIEIMQLVGAPQTFIRGPFVMEGVLQGGTGAVLALGGLLAGYLVVRGRYLAPAATAMDLSSIRFMPLELCVMLVIGGMLVGCVGGMVAAWSR